MTAQKKILVLGAGYHQVPLIEKAKDLGYFVISLSNKEDDFGKDLADRFYLISTLDKEEVIKVARKENVDGIITMASEVAAPTVAYVAESLKLPGFNLSQAETISNKFFLRSRLKEAGLTKLFFAPAYSLNEAMDFFKSVQKEMMLKPMLASGSKGIKKIATADELPLYFQQAVDSSLIYKGVLLEQFVEGRHLGGELIVRNGKIVFYLLSDKIYNTHFVTTAHLVPAELSDYNRKQVLELLQNVVTALQLKDGILDVDLVLTEYGPEVIELGGRLGGNGISQLVEFFSGVDLISVAIKIAMNENYTINERQSMPMAALIIGSSTYGIVNEISQFENEFPRDANALILQRDFVKQGEKVFEFTQGSYQTGNLFVKKNKREELIQLVEEIQKREWIKTK